MHTHPCIHIYVCMYVCIYIYIDVNNFILVPDIVPVEYLVLVNLKGSPAAAAAAWRGIFTRNLSQMPRGIGCLGRNTGHSY